MFGWDKMVQMLSNANGCIGAVWAEVLQMTRDEMYDHDRMTISQDHQS